MRTGFDNKKYIKLQSKKIKERIKLFDKLYLEIGGKLFDDSHASRVLPGFESDAKIQMLKELKDDLEIIFCINAGDIEKNKVRAEHGITYDIEVMRLIDNLRSLGFSINSVVVTLYKNQPSVDTFLKKLERNNIKTNNPYLFLGQKNKNNSEPLNRNFCNRLLNKYKNLCNIKDLHPHMLRAYFCSNALHNAGYSIDQVANQAGHYSLNTTKGYLSTQQEDIISLADKLWQNVPYIKWYNMLYYTI